MKTEILPIRITLESNYLFIAPETKININNDTVFNGKLKAGRTIIDTTQTLDFNKTHCIKIVRTGKHNKFPEQTCRVLDICIDRISICDLVYHTSVYYPEYPEPWASEQKEKGIELEYPVFGETIFGHNGVWEFEFTSPFYQFLISKVKGQ